MANEIMSEEAMTAFLISEAQRVLELDDAALTKVTNMLRAAYQMGHGAGEEQGFNRAIKQVGSAIQAINDGCELHAKRHG